MRKIVVLLMIVCLSCTKTEKNELLSILQEQFIETEQEEGIKKTILSSGKTDQLEYVVWTYHKSWYAITLNRIPSGAILEQIQDDYPGYPMEFRENHIDVFSILVEKDKIEEIKSILIQ